MAYSAEEECWLDLFDSGTMYDGIYLCPYCEHFDGEINDRAAEHFFADNCISNCGLIVSWAEEARKTKGDTPKPPCDPNVVKQELDDRTVSFIDSCDKYKRIFIDFNLYMKSTMWEDTRNRILERDGYQCAFCGSAKNLQVHHITYKNIPYEEDDDLITVCNKCHGRLHKMDIVRKRKNNAS